MSTRRELLSFGLAAGAAGVVSLPAQSWAAGAPVRAPSPKVLAVQNLHTGEKIEACYWENGKFVPDACAALNKVLRDHRTGEVHMIDPGLYDILTAVSGKLGKRPTFQIISGYRSPKSNAMLRKNGGGGVATHSLHMDGKAMDVRLPGVALTDLHKAALSLKKGGVGFYPVSNFVHVDTGRVRQWKGA
jgi:uncharacterized protein YcbK (DUF882 family)